MLAYELDQGWEAGEVRLVVDGAVPYLRASPPP